MDYHKLGMKSGIEIHQQLDTGKLFSRCNSVLTSEKPDSVIMRKIRASSGETGKIDIAAAFETSKNLTYNYEVHNSNTSLVETDEAPPLLIDQEAFEIALIVCKMLNCKVVPIVQVMRKTVVDGSNTSGFQRTCLLGTSGYINTSKGKVSIDTVILEEDSARRVAKTKDSVTYRLDRLGIPLIEIATGPDMKDPEHIKETAQLLGTLLRSTGKVMRGIGTIRQDVNISIKGGGRIELKGVQDLNTIINIIETEVKRQKSELSMKRKVGGEVRNVKSDGTSKYLRPMPGASRMYPETDLPLIKINFEEFNNLKIPELIPDKIKRYIKNGLNEDLAERIANSRNTNIFDKIINKNSENATLVATTILSTSKEIKRKLKLELGIFPSEFYINIFKLINNLEITKESIPTIMERFAKGELLEEIKIDYKPLSDSEISNKINEIINKNPSLSYGALIGKAMSHFAGRADGKKVVKIIGAFKK